jgi:choline dehydrogenase
MSNHGTTGVIHSTLPREPIPGLRTFLDACEDAGFSKIMDTNSGDPIGSGMVQMAIWKGARSSSATQLLNTEFSLGKGVKRQSNLEVKVETRVNKVLFLGKKAIGVEVEGGRKCRFIYDLYVPSGH